MNAPHASSPPIFILSHARTGSTLLRYLVDTHPEVCCPPELALGRLCSDLVYTLSLTLAAAATGDASVDRTGEVTTAVRGQIDGIMQAYCARKGKARWCDKSTNNVLHLETLSRVFPDAQYIILHRNALDVVFSLIEMFRYGFPGRYGELVAGSPNNVVNAMLDGWSEAAEKLIAFEAASPERCLRLTYEDLVSSPEPTVRSMFAFLNLPFETRLLDAAFSAAHDPGPGDVKIQFTSHVLRNRIGKGRQIPREHISEDRLIKLNALHEALGYPAVRRDGSGSAFFYLLRDAGRVARPVHAQRWG